ncbi:hypothetical protein [Granulosicoccus antarcticus]|uniref:Uncharacterized protein n=1 Tax=Granulosicoccus antarcticus IMCC3135 TaxID=1192854 RepID=A0A2Z2NLB6_9GAMM|nr:hypothetical protein [Granulosicoccus antarcticus]ASJ72126.1 hypothetical protein IMCC3135_10160 [Granulosicoccus antarcticus IMCC3135]
MNKIIRKKLAVPKKASVVDIAPRAGLVIDLGKKGLVEAGWFDSVENSTEIIRELSIYVRGKRNSRGTVNTVLQYLRFVAVNRLQVSSDSAKAFRNELDRRKNITPNTKYQIFSTAMGFHRSAIAAGVLPEENLPQNFRTPTSEPKKNFVDLCRVEIASLDDSSNDTFRNAISDRGLNAEQAQALQFSINCMQSLRLRAVNSVQQIVEDWNRVYVAIESLSETDLAQLRECDFRRLDDKTLEAAFRILYAHFGFSLPATKAWPAGISDWCKGRDGWTSNRVKGAFFPVVKTLDPFLLLLLSDDSLSLNVDSAAMYSYIDSCRPSKYDEFTDVYFGKYRGSPTRKCLRTDNPTIVGICALSEKLEKTLPFMPGGAKWLSNERAPLMVHWSTFSGLETKLRGLDPSTPVNMVKRFIGIASKEFPCLLPLVGRTSGENFRPTHALIKKLSGESIDKIRLGLNHKNISTTKVYVDRLETQAMLKNKHLLFQRYLIEEAVDTRRTGSGYVCSNPVSDGCVQHTQCFECDAKRVVLKSPSIVAEWIALEEHIRLAEYSLSVSNPERWEYFWKPKLIEYQTLIDMVDERYKNEAILLTGEVLLPWLS